MVALQYEEVVSALNGDSFRAALEEAVQSAFLLDRRSPHHEAAS